MEELPVELARSIFNLELQKTKIIDNDKKTKRLCRCRRKMLANYSSVCQQFFIRVSAKIIKYVTSRDMDNVTILDLKGWYDDEIYTKLYEDDRVSTKMVLIFQLLQETIDDNFFDRFEPKFKSAIGHIDQPDFNTQIHDLYGDINEWMEIYLQNILSLKIDCTHIAEELLTQYNKVENFDCIHNADGSHCIGMCDGCPAIEIGHDVYYASEELHLYVSEEYEDGAFLGDYFELLHKFHTRPENIAVVFDFRLCESSVFKLTQVHKNLITFAAKSFKSVHIINHKKISFGKYRSEIEQYFTGAK